MEKAGLFWTRLDNRLVEEERFDGEGGQDIAVLMF